MSKRPSADPRAVQAAPPRAEGGRLAPPRSGPGVLVREALVQRLLDARRKRCVLVRGPAGFGKTTLLASWLQALLPLGFDVAWLSLEAHDDALAPFVDGLVAAFAEVDPALIREAAELADAAIDADGAERLVIALVRRIAEHPRDLVLVLDDVHHLNDPAVLETLQWLLDYAPPGLHLVLGTRGAMRLSLDALRAQGQLFELELRDLRFSLTEAEQFLKLQLGEVDARTVKLLYELSDGWVAGLQLFAIDWKNRQRLKGEGGVGFTRVPMRDPEAFARYFDQEVLNRLSPGDLESLVRLSACERFCAPLCAALDDKRQSAGEAAAMLRRLQADNLFIVEIDGKEAEPWYRLHPLLRETLQRRLAARSAAEQRELHARAWAWLRDHGRVDEAVGHAIRAGEEAAAALLVEQHAQSLVTRGDRRRLFELLRQLPPEQLRQRPALGLWQVRALINARDLPAAAARLDQLAQDLADGGAGARFSLAMLRAFLAVQRDDTDGAMAVLPQLQDAPPQADSVALGGRNNILSWLFMHRGEFERARRIQFDAPTLLVDGAPLLGTPAGSLQGRCLVGLSYAMEGQITKAERIYRAVLSEAAQGGKACADPAAMASALLGEVLYERNDIQGVRLLLEHRVDVLERVSIPDSVLRVLRVLAAAHWLSGNPQEAFAYLDRLEDYAQREGLDRLLAYSLSDRMSRLLIQGDLTSAEALLLRLEEVDARHPQAEHSALGEIHELALRTRVRWLVAVHDFDAAAARFGPLIALCEARGRQRSAAQLLLQSALVDSRSGRAQGANAKVMAALQLGHRLGLLRSLLDADAQARELIDGVARDQALDPVLAFYVERLQATRAARTRDAASASAAPRGQAPTEAFSEREQAVLRLLAQAMPNKKIARALSLSPETVKWYLSRIYGKLQVSGRDEAVARVRDLQLGGARQP